MADVPEDELILAKLIQNARGRGLEWCSGYFYVDKHGNQCNPDEAVACCAVGAADLEEDTRAAVGGRRMPMIMANDYGDNSWRWADGEYNALEVVGHAYRLAMQGEDDE